MADERQIFEAPEDREPDLVFGFLYGEDCFSTENPMEPGQFAARDTGAMGELEASIVDVPDGWMTLAELTKSLGTSRAGLRRHIGGILEQEVCVGRLSNGSLAKIVSPDIATIIQRAMEDQSDESGDADH